MKLSSADIYSYSLKLNRPLHVHKKDITVREGLILHVKSTDNAEGFGEIAPLPGFSTETLEEAAKEIQNFRHFLLSETIPPNIEKLDKRFETWLAKFNLKSSVRFGIEMAILNLTANHCQKTLYKVLSDLYHENIRVSGLLSGPTSEVTQELKRMLDDGYRSFKLKVGEDVKEDIAKVLAAIKTIDGRALLHLDVNQGWNINQAVHFIDEVGLAFIEYVEEPFKNIDHIPEFFAKTTVPVALDESFAGLHFNHVKSIDGVDLVILKPTIIGSIENVCKIMKEGQRLAISTVISSLFESSIGILTLANLAGMTHRDNFAGIDTLKWLKEDLLKQPLTTHHGRLDISSRRIQFQDINFNLLKKLNP